MFTPLVTAIAAAALSVVAAVVAAFQSRASWPNDVRKRLEVAEADVRAAQLEAERAAQDARKAHGDMAAMAEDIEGVMESVEKKRRRIAAHRSAVEAREQQQQAGDGLAPHGSPERQRQIELLARQRSFM